MNKSSFISATLAVLMSWSIPSFAQNPNMTPEKMAEFQKMLQEQQKKGKLAPGVVIPGAIVKETPSDQYAGPDKADLVQLTKSTWEKNYPQDKILGIKIGMKDWERKTEKRWNEGTSSWHQVDYSSIQVMVIVKKDDQTAWIYPFGISKDHTDNNKLSLDATGRDNPMLHRQIAWSDLKL